MHICRVRVCTCVCLIAESVCYVYVVGSQFLGENSPSLNYHLLPKETNANVEGEILLGSSLDVY